MIIGRIIIRPPKFGLMAFRVVCFGLPAFYLAVVVGLLGLMLFYDHQPVYCTHPGTKMTDKQMTIRCQWSSLYSVVENFGRATVGNLTYPGLSSEAGKTQRSYLRHPFIPVL